MAAMIALLAHLARTLPVLLAAESGSASAQEARDKASELIDRAGKAGKSGGGGAPADTDLPDLAPDNSTYDSRNVKGPFTWFGDLLDAIGAFLGDVFRPVGDFFAVIGRAIGSVFSALASIIPGGAFVAWILVAALAILLVWAIVRWVATREESANASKFKSRGSVRSLAPGDLEEVPELPIDELERLAMAAETDGDFDLAVQLLFQIGVLRLRHAGIIEDRSSLTNGEVCREVHHSSLNRLTLTFEQVVYGGLHADSDDLATAHLYWPRVLRDKGALMAQTEAPLG